MSIALIRLKPKDGNAIPREVSAHLAERACAAGKTLAVRQCGRAAEAMECLQRAEESRLEFVLLDPGDASNEVGELREALEASTVPFVEVHDDHFGALESPLRAGSEECMGVVQGYGPQSYTLALSIALEHLGCAEPENELHIGI